MKKKTKPTLHKGSHRVAANHHRHIHKGVSTAIIGLWLAIGILTAVAAVSFLDSRHNIRVVDDRISIKADKVSYDDVGKYPFLPGKGMQFVIVHITVKNHRDTAFDFAPVLQTYITDNQGGQYFMAPANLKDPINAGKLMPGENRQGSLSYLVPVSARGITFHFQL